MQHVLSRAPPAAKSKKRAFYTFFSQCSYSESKRGVVGTAYTKKGYCIGALGSMTNAIKATRTLARYGIFAEVIGLSATETKRGCAYGISFDCDAFETVRNALKSEGITVSQYLQRGGAP